MRGLQRRWLAVAAGAAALVMVLAACSQSPATATPGADSNPQKQAGASGNAGVFNGLDFSALSQEQVARLTSYPGSLSSSQQQGIWVNGTGSIMAQPDTAILHLGVEARADTVAEARDQAAQAMDNVMQVLRDHGIEERDIRTQHFNIQPITVWRETSRGEGRQEIIGYMVTNLVTVTVRAIDSAGEVIDAVAQAAGDTIRINGISFTIDDPKPLENQARELALQDATAKARQIAQVTGVTLGSPVFISESSSTPVYAREELRAVPSAGDASITTPISPGENEVRIQVQMVFAIQ